MFTISPLGEAARQNGGRGQHQVPHFGGAQPQRAVARPCSGFNTTCFQIIVLNQQTPFQNKLFTRGPVYKKSTADIEEKIREINRAVEAKIEEQEKKLQEEPTVEQVEEAIDTLTDLAAIEVVAEEMAEAAIMADEMAEVEKEMMVDAEEDVKEMVDLKVVDIGESLAEEIAEEIKEEIVEEMEAEELVEELVMEEMIKEAVIDEVEAAAVEENIIESEVTTVDPSEEEVDFGDITEVAVWSDHPSSWALISPCLYHVNRWIIKPWIVPKLATNENWVWVKRPKLYL